MKRSLEIAGLLLGFLLATAGFAKAWFVLPYRVEQLEVTAARIEARNKDDDTIAKQQGELLTRIDERTAAMQRDIAELKARR